MNTARIVVEGGATADNYVGSSMPPRGAAPNGSKFTYCGIEKTLRKLKRTHLIFNFGFRIKITYCKNKRGKYSEGHYVAFFKLNIML